MDKGLTIRRSIVEDFSKTNGKMLGDGRRMLQSLNEGRSQEETGGRMREKPL